MTLRVKSTFTHLQEASAVLDVLQLRQAKLEKIVHKFAEPWKLPAKIEAAIEQLSYIIKTSVIIHI